MGYNAHIDLKVAVFNVSNHSAKVECAQGSHAKGLYNERIALRFDGDLLKGRDSDGAELFLQIRSDGHMNIGWRQNTYWCTGILKRTQASPIDRGKAAWEIDGMS